MSEIQMRDGRTVSLEEARRLEAEGPRAAVLVFGILGISFACTVYFSFLGIIFSAVGMGKAGQILRKAGIITGVAKVGRVLSKTGLILSIVFTAIIMFVVFCIVIASLY